MRICLVSEGESELVSLPKLYPQLQALGNLQFVKALKISICPGEPYGTMAKKCKSVITICKQKRVNLVVILLDRDRVDECPGQIARQLVDAIGHSGPMRVAVVVKNDCFENWTISDPDALAGLNGFTISNEARRRITPGKADNVKAEDWLKGVSDNNSFDKTRDNPRIYARMNIKTMESNSRSFRKFVKVLSHT